MKLFLLLIAMAYTCHANYIREIDLECRRPCTFLLAPVCGFDGSCYDDFANDCLMKIENCMRRRKKRPELRELETWGYCPKGLKRCQK